MGGGAWDTGAYHSSRSTRAATGVKDFDYTTTATKVHASLDPRRIADKPCKKLEARDSTEHPESNPVLVCFDVTGSNYARAIDAQQRLPHLMDLLNKYLTDPQVAVAANDDYNYVGVNAVQISDFESDNRVDDHIRNIWLTREGGGNDGESYDLIFYAAARKVALDAVEKRGRKGYLFLYADEPIFTKVNKNEVRAVYGDVIEKDIPIEEILEEARRNFNVFLIWPEGGYDNAREQFIKLVGEESVLVLQHPNLICELIASAIGLHESKATPDSVVTDLVAVGVSDNEARALARTTACAAAALAPTSARKAARL